MRWGPSFGLAVALSACLTPGVRAGLIFSENFDTLEHNAAITADNTDLNFIRGTVTAANPSPLGSGAAAQFTTPNTPSLTGFGATGLPASDVVSMEFKFQTSQANTAFTFGMGTGSTFSGTAAFTQSSAPHMSWGLRLLGQQLEYFKADGTWVEISDEFLDSNTTYTLRVVANGSAAPVNYGGLSLAAGRAHVFVNGELWVDASVPIIDSVAASAFRIYGTNNRTTYYVDDVRVWDAAEPMPEPASVTMLIVGAVGVLRLKRR